MQKEQYALNVTGTTVCKMCRGTLVIDPGTSERICSRCGMVNDVQNVEPTNYGTSVSLGTEEPSALSDSALGMKYDLNLPSLIGRKNSDAHGRKIVRNYDFERLRNLDNLTIYTDTKWRNLSKAIDEIRRITETMGLGDSVAERAYQSYRKFYSNGLTKGKMISGVAMATVWLACKELGVARTDKEIEALFKGPRVKSVRKYYHLLLRQTENGNSATTDSTSYVSRIVKQSGLGGRTERKALEIISKVKDDPALIGKRPISIAAAAVFIAASAVGEPTTQMRVANASEVTPITIRNRAAEISKIIDNQSSPNSPEQVPLPESLA